MSKSTASELDFKPSQTTRVATTPASGVNSTPRDDDYLPGEVIEDRYKLVRELGRGGMGVVWVARSLVLDVDVALKLIRAAETGAEAASRMAREANAAARVSHPALVRVFDFGWTRHGDPFLVMELIRGEPLSETIARDGGLPAIRAVQLLLPVADGLRLAHSRSIVHRDIKPGNIVVAKEGTNRLQPKLLDFGIAKVGTSGDGKLTQQGAVLGSPEYMSPEQALGLDHVDARSDVWSFAIALYELITGHVPFSRPNYNALMQVIIHSDPPPLPGASGGDASLWALLSKALEKHPKDRWASMDEFGSALALWLYDHGIKEDASGNSVRAVWLDEGLDGPPAARHSTLPPKLQAALESLGLPPVPKLDLAAGTPSSADADELLVPPKRKRKWLLAAGACLLAVGFVVMLSDDGDESQAVTRETPVADITPHTDVRSGESESDSAERPIRQAVDPEDLPLAEPEPAPATPPRPRVRPTRSSSSPKKNKSKRDFGF